MCTLLIDKYKYDNNSLWIVNLDEIYGRSVNNAKFQINIVIQLLLIYCDQLNLFFHLDAFVYLISRELKIN